MIDQKKTALGIELGSTRIKAVLIDEDHRPLASGSYNWESRYENGIWTYPMEQVITGLQACFADLARDFREHFCGDLVTTGAIGISAMMHGYLPFDGDGNQLAEFRTWQNTITGQAAAELSEAFGFNIPQRWSIAHLYQAILNGEAHVPGISRLTTLAGHIHYLLTGCHVMGIGEASGMFPIDSGKLDYNEEMLEKFDVLAASKGFGKKLRDILPSVLTAGDEAGRLTEAGALLLDPTGRLLPGIPFAPCEGDAGTGMTATDSVRVNTGNVSAGTSDFAMVVTEHMPGVHREIDMVTTPAGLPVAMIHCNNCTPDLNSWAGIFAEFASAMGFQADMGDVFTTLFNKALEGESDCGGLLNYNYLAGEGVTGLDEGRPLFIRKPDARFTLANFMRAQLLSALSTLKIGLDILTGTENVKIEKFFAHGGFFKTPRVGQLLLSAAAGVPVAVMETAGEGGPYGMALLAAYMLRREDGEALEDYLDDKVFKNAATVTLTAGSEDIAGFDRYLAAYKSALSLERMATEVF